jgi:hypothetical protein
MTLTLGSHGANQRGNVDGLKTSPEKRKSKMEAPGMKLYADSILVIVYKIVSSIIVTVIIISQVVK